jgi:hypothetical protein
METVRSWLNTAVAVFLFTWIVIFCGYANARMFPKGHEPKIHIHSASGTGLTQAQFDEILTRFEASMKPLYTAKGQQLQINRLWSDSTINSDAHWEGSICVINAYGGLARAMYMSPKIQAMLQARHITEAELLMQLAYGLVNGHENGHCLGGAPFYPGENMSDEGQADTFAVDAGRKAGYTDYQIVAGSEILTDVLASLNQEAAVLWIGPALPVVVQTNHEHPSAQCRYITMLYRFFGAERPNCWYRGGTVTGPSSPLATKKLPTKTPVPTPTPIPQPTPIPAPFPKPCDCCAVMKELVKELKASNDRSRN